MSPRKRHFSAVVTILAAISFCSFLPTTLGQHPVGLKSKYADQILTSSTLQWAPYNGNKKLFDQAVVGSEEVPAPKEGVDLFAESIKTTKIFVCRARHNGIWISGGCRDDGQACVVSMHGKVIHNIKFDILQNVEGGAFLNWEKWDKFRGIPTGSVTGGDGHDYIAYVARRKPDNNNAVGPNYYLGKLDPNLGLAGKIIAIESDNKEHEYENGEILVETEPVRYELKGISRKTFRKRVTRIPKMLVSTTLINDDEGSDEPTNVDSILSYNYTRTQYWGQGHGASTGLPLKVLHNNGTLMGNLTWGTRGHEQRQELFRVEANLPPGTAVNVTLHGNLTKLEVPFTGYLVSYYPNEKSVSREIAGMLEWEDMMNVTAVYGPVYFLSNNTLIPTTTTTTTTTTTSTTTSTTTEEPAPVVSPPEEPVDVSTRFAKKGGENPDTKKGENNSMQSDEGGALSLEKKDERSKDNGKGGASTIKGISFSYLFLLIGLLIYRLV